MKKIEIVSCELVGHNLPKAIEAAGLSQETTARRTGVMTSRQLTRIISGEHCPSLVRATALSVVLGVSIYKLFRIKVRTRKVRKVA